MKVERIAARAGAVSRGNRAAFQVPGQRTFTLDHRALDLINRVPCHKSAYGTDCGGRTTVTGSRVTSYMIELTKSQIAYLASQRLGRLATTGADHKPHVVPTSYHFNPELGTVDVGGHHVATTKKYRDVQVNGWAAIVVDDLLSIDPWRPRMLEIRGRAEPVPAGGSTLGPGFGEAFIRIYPDKVNSFGID